MLLLAILAALTPLAVGAARTVFSLDQDWAFNLTSDEQPAPYKCELPGCARDTVDGAWRHLSVPHDFIVEGNFSQSANPSHGFLPYASAWYRKHIALDVSLANAVLVLEFGAVSTQSVVFINGVFVGQTLSGYTIQQYTLDNSILSFGAGSDNVVAVYSDGSQPDGWCGVFLVSAQPRLSRRQAFLFLCPEPHTRAAASSTPHKLKSSTIALKLSICARQVV